MSMITDLMVNTIDKLPESLIWNFAKRYIAGSDLDSGLQVRKDLFGQGMMNTMDVLGENTESEQDAEKAMVEYLDLIKGMSKDGLPGNVSLKLTQLGLCLDEKNTRNRVIHIAENSWENDFFFRLDMEDVSTTDQTLDLYKTLRKMNDRVGVVIQAYLKRSLDDIRELAGTQPANIRICKGIYKEEKRVAYHDRQKIRDNFMDILRLMFDLNSYPAIATHDPFLIRAAMSEIQRRGLSPDKYEFQMLHGVGFKWRKELLDKGHNLRIYIPYGAAWRAYSIRRFRENPTLAFYVVKNIIVPN